MGLFSLIGSLVGGGAAKKASRKAEAAQLAYMEKALDEQRRQFDVTRGDFQPYMEAGKVALGQQGDLIGLNGSGVQASAIEALRGSPFYTSLLRNGEEALLANASATGGLRGGNMQRGLADFRADLLGQTIERQLAQLGGLSGMGQNATGSVGEFGATKANNVSNILGQQGAVRAGGLLTRGGITAQGWNNAGSFLDNAVKAALGAGAFGAPGAGSGVATGSGVPTGFGFSGGATPPPSGFNPMQFFGKLF